MDAEILDIIASIAVGAFLTWLTVRVLKLEKQVRALRRERER